MFNTPILFLLFNRIETTRQVFPQIKKMKPAQLFIAADGPRGNVTGEKEKCEEVRTWVLSQIDWKCELKTLFRKENLGCKYAVSSAIDWFFENVEEGIILEDDCLPNESFFNFCETLLEKYRYENKIKHISGNNFQGGKKYGLGDYYFSEFNHVWGWASWRRAWLEYDVEMKTLDSDAIQFLLKKRFKQKIIQKYWLKIFELVKNDFINTWDYQWTFCIWNNSGFSILPQLNLVSNIGFLDDATHTTDVYNWTANLPALNLIITKHPKYIRVSKKADINTAKDVLNLHNLNKTRVTEIKRLFKTTFKKIFQQ